VNFSEPGSSGRRYLGLDSESTTCCICCLATAGRWRIVIVTGLKNITESESCRPPAFPRIRCALAQLICSEESGRYFIAHLDQWLSVSFDTGPVQSRSDVLQRDAEDGVANFLQGQFSVIVAFGNNHLYHCMESIGGFFVLEASNFRCGGSHKGI
jgi:hypothetical protein